MSRPWHHSLLFAADAWLGRMMGFRRRGVWSAEGSPNGRDRFAEVWRSNHCPPTFKKMIFRTAIEEILVRTDQDKKSLELVLHWKGGAHTQVAMERPGSAAETATPTEALDIIRCMVFATATTRSPPY